MQNPVSPGEVADALSDLTAALGVGSAVSVPSSPPASIVTPPARRAASDGGWTSSSDTGTADALMAAAELGAPAAHGPAPMDRLASVVTNVLNDPVAGPSICRVLARDREFQELIWSHAAHAAAALPAPARAVAALPGPEGWVPPAPRRRRDNPIDAFLEGVVAAVVRATVALGSAIRRLPEDIATLLRGVRPRQGDDAECSGAGPTALALAEAHEAWDAAFTRVVTAVAVALLARRAVLRVA